MTGALNIEDLIKISLTNLIRIVTSSLNSSQNTVVKESNFRFSLTGFYFLLIWSLVCSGFELHDSVSVVYISLGKVEIEGLCPQSFHTPSISNP